MLSPLSAWDRPFRLLVLLSLLYAAFVYTQHFVFRHLLYILKQYIPNNNFQMINGIFIGYEWFDMILTGVVVVCIDDITTLNTRADGLYNCFLLVPYCVDIACQGEALYIIGAVIYIFEDIGQEQSFYIFVSIYICGTQGLWIFLPSICIELSLGIMVFQKQIIDWISTLSMGRTQYELLGRVILCLTFRVVCIVRNAFVNF